MKPEYCTQNNGDCGNCSLSSYGRDCKNNLIKLNLLNSKQIRKLLGGISRQSFWQLKVRKNFPNPEYSQDRIELWEEKKIKEYIKKRNKT